MCTPKIPASLVSATRRRPPTALGRSPSTLSTGALHIHTNILTIIYKYVYAYSYLTSTSQRPEIFKTFANAHHPHRLRVHSLYI